MIQTSSNWENRIQVKKGNLGEQIVKEKLEQRGYVIYKGITESAHAFDFLAVKNKIQFLIAEVKSKARMNKYYATGIDVRHYEEYIAIYNKYKIDIMLFFVDEHPEEERIYCGDLKQISIKKVVDGINYPNQEIAKGIILFSLTDMINIAKLTKEEIFKLKEYSTRNYSYT